MNKYTGYYDDVNWYSVQKDGKPFDHVPSLAVRNHSPDGFAWGYCGSGPAQLALAMLLEETGDVELAEAFYQDFKFKVIVALSNECPENDDDPLWELTSKQIREALHGIIENQIKSLEDRDSEEFYCGETVGETLHKYRDWIRRCS